MTTSSSRSDNRTSTQDLRTTNTINAGIGGDIDGSLVNSGNYGDTSLSNYVDESESNFTDDSDNSFNLDLEDNSDHSIDSSVTNITDGEAFQLVENFGIKFLDTLGESQSEILNGANDLASRSLDAAFSIKAGQAINEPVSNNLKELTKAGVTVAGVGAAVYLGSKLLGGNA